MFDTTGISWGSREQQLRWELPLITILGRVIVIQPLKMVPWETNYIWSCPEIGVLIFDNLINLINLNAEKFDEQSKIFQRGVPLRRWISSTAFRLSVISVMDKHFIGIQGDLYLTIIFSTWDVGKSKEKIVDKPSNLTKIANWQYLAISSWDRIYIDAWMPETVGWIRVEYVFVPCGWCLASLIFHHPWWFYPPTIVYASTPYSSWKIWHVFQFGWWFLHISWFSNICLGSCS